MSQPKQQLTLAERWAADEELMADSPRQPDVQPRWITDGLTQFGPDAPAQPSPDDLGPDEL